MCPVCGLTKWDVEKGGQNFEKHKQKTHNFWNYVFLLVNIVDKNENDLNGVEYQIYRDYHNQKLNWIPNRVFRKASE